MFRFNAQEEVVLHSFGSGGDGSGPVASLVFDATGNLYGTTEYGGTDSMGRRSRSHLRSRFNLSQ